MATPTVTGAPQGAAPVVPRATAGRLPVLWPLLCLQAAGALVLLGAAADNPVVAALAVLPAGLPALVVAAWRQGESLPAWAGAGPALRRRLRRAADPLPAGEDAPASLVRECLPGLECRPFEVRGGRDGRERREVGLLAGGGTLTAVLRVTSVPSPLQPGYAARPLPLALLHGALETDGIRLASVQAVQHTQPAPAPTLPERSVAGASYRLLHAQGLGGAPALRLTWVALRLDPELCPAAVAERGGGLAGARRCLTRVADQLASRLAGAGFTATVLSPAEVPAAVAACVSADPAVTTALGLAEGPRPRRTAESARDWRCDGRRHATFRVGRWPALGPAATPLPGLVAALTSLPAFATTFALTLRPRARGAVAVSAHVRITGRDEGELAALAGGLQQAARAAGVGLVRMDRRQLPGVWATVPAGGAW